MWTSWSKLGKCDKLGSMYAVVRDNNNFVEACISIFLSDSERIEGVRMNKKKMFVNCKVYLLYV